MMRIGLIKNNVCTGIIVADSGEPYGTEGVDWIDMAGRRGGPGWVWDGENLTPPVKPTRVRTLLTLREWVETWTPGEWRQLKRAASGDLSPTPIPENVSERLDQLLDSIRLTNSFDVKSETADQFYGYLEAQNFIDSARRAELQSGVTE